MSISLKAVAEQPVCALDWNPDKKGLFYRVFGKGISDIYIENPKYREYFFSFQSKSNYFQNNFFKSKL